MDKATTPPPLRYGKSTSQASPTANHNRSKSYGSSSFFELDHRSVTTSAPPSSLGFEKDFQGTAANRTLPPRPTDWDLGSSNAGSERNPGRSRRVSEVSDRRRSGTSGTTLTRPDSIPTGSRLDANNRMSQSASGASGTTLTGPNSTGSRLDANNHMSLSASRARNYSLGSQIIPFKAQPSWTSRIDTINTPARDIPSKHQASLNSRIDTINHYTPARDIPSKHQASLTSRIDTTNTPSIPSSALKNPVPSAFQNITAKPQCPETSRGKRMETSPISYSAPNTVSGSEMSLKAPASQGIRGYRHTPSIPRSPEASSRGKRMETSPASYSASNAVSGSENMNLMAPASQLPRGYANDTPSIPKATFNTSQDPITERSTSQQGNIDNSPPRPGKKTTRNTPAPAKPIDTEVGSGGGLKRPRVDSSSSEDDGPIKSSQRLKKKSRNEHSVTVGFHTDEPLIQIFAKYSARPKVGENFQIVYAYALKTPDLPDSVTLDSRWNQLVNKNNQVNIGKVILSSTVFPQHIPELQDMSKKRKLELIKELLNAQKTVDDPMEDEDQETAASTLYKSQAPVKWVYDPEFLMIGYHRYDEIMKVHAFVEHPANQIEPSVMFTVLTDDGREGEMDFSELSVRDPRNILLKPEFKKDDMEATKMEILSRFERSPVGQEGEDSSSRQEKMPPIENCSRVLRWDEETDSEAETIAVRPRLALGLSNSGTSKNDKALSIANSLRLAQTGLTDLLTWSQQLNDEKAKLPKDKSDLEVRETAVKKSEDDLKTREKKLKDDLKTREKKLEEDRQTREDVISAQVADLAKDRKGFADSKKEQVAALDIRERALATAEKAFVERQTIVAKPATTSSLEGQRLKDAERNLEEKDALLNLQLTVLEERKKALVAQEEKLQLQQPQKDTPLLSFAFAIPTPLIRYSAYGTFEQNYRRIPEDQPNAGMYIRMLRNEIAKVEKMFFNSQRYLAEYTGEALGSLTTIPKIVVGGVKLEKTVQVSGIPYEEWNENGIRKLVQVFGPGSFTFHEGRFFISWRVYKETTLKWAV